MKGCSFPGCEGRHNARGYCKMHYNQVIRGRPLTARRYTWGASAERDADGQKRCYGCREWKATGEFSPVANTADGLTTRCARCRRSDSLRRRYGIDADTYDALLAEQGGRCAVCGASEGKMSAALHVDHDHATGRVRGILCGICNTRLGWYEDYADSVAYYLEGATA